MSEKKVGIILAAGKGMRLGELTNTVPKPLLEVGDKALLGYMIEFVQSLGITRTIVVGGFMFSHIQSYLSQHYPEVEVIENSQFHLQNLLSFEAGYKATQADESVFVCNADYIFLSHTKDAVLPTLNSDEIIIYGSHDLSGDATDVMKVCSDKDEKVLGLSKQLVEFNGIYTGMFYIPVNKRPAVDLVVGKLLHTGDLEKTTVESIFHGLIQVGVVVRIADVGKADWFEVDTEEELIKARNKHLSTK